MTTEADIRRKYNKKIEETAVQIEHRYRKVIDDLKLQMSKVGERMEIEINGAAHDLNHEMVAEMRELREE